MGQELIKVLIIGGDSIVCGKASLIISEIIEGMGNIAKITIGTTGNLVSKIIRNEGKFRKVIQIQGGSLEEISPEIFERGAKDCWVI